MFSGIKQAVFFAAHTDDEMICAGTLRRLVREGVRVHVVAFGPAGTVDDRAGTWRSVEVVREEFARSMRAIGVDAVDATFLRWVPSVSAVQDRRQEVADYVFAFVERVKPDLALVLSPDDENPAHSVLGVECERVMRGRVPVTVRCQFPWNMNIGRANLFVKLKDEDFAAKKKVIEAYKSQHFRYAYGEMLLSYCVADGLAVKSSPVERFELLRGVL